MSELINQNHRRNSVRLELLAGVSTVAFAIFLNNATAGEHDDSATIWVELGSQLERVDGGGERFKPVFEAGLAQAGMLTPSSVEVDPRYSFGGEAKVTFMPSASDWRITAAIRYGRSNGGKHRYQQRPVTPVTLYHGTVAYPSQNKTSDSLSKQNEGHFVVDFKAGKDIGIGTQQGTDVTLSLGVRAAQFSSNSSLKASGLWGFYHSSPPPLHLPIINFDQYVAQAQVARNFSGIGPSLSVDGTSAIDRSEQMNVSFDWSANASLLFGRQKTEINSSTVDNYHHSSFLGGQHIYPTTAIEKTIRSRSAVIPNVGGSLALSLNFPRAKVTLGYRGDFFFGAVDGGIDTRKTYDRNFYGPFATISIGVSPFDF